MYTTDRSAPSASNGSQYQGPVTIDQSTIVKAIALKDGCIGSDIAEQTYTLKVQSPSVSPAAAFYRPSVSVTLSTVTPNTTIRYTIDGSVPSRENGNSYAQPIILTDTTVIRYVAFREGWADSDVMTANYTVVPYGTVASPSLSPSPGTYYDPRTVTLSCGTSGATLRFTVDGSLPSTTNGTVYSVPISVSRTTTIRAIAYKDGWINSAVSGGDYAITVSTPAISPVGGTYTKTFNATIDAHPSDAKIMYTIDGSDPTLENGLTYNGAIQVSGPMTLKARAYRDGWTSSVTACAIFTLKAADPVFVTTPGAYSVKPLSITMNAPSNGSLIRYTIDGSDPRVSGITYNGPIVIDSSATVKAIAIHEGWADSNIVSGDYRICVATPQISPSEGHYSTGQTVTISTATDGAIIRYSIDGNDPINGFGMEYNGPFTVNSTARVKAIAFKSGWENSAVACSTFAINSGPLTVTVLEVNGAPYVPFMRISTNSWTGIRYTVTNGSGGRVFCGWLMNAGQTVDMTFRWFENHYNDPNNLLSFNPPQGKTGTWIITLIWKDRTTWPWNQIDHHVYFTVVD